VPTDETCDYLNDGTLTLSVTGGTADYTCSLDGVSWDGTSTHVVSGLSAGIKSVTITDANGCTANGSYTINQPAALTISSGIPTDETCDYLDNGTLSLSVTGGTANYTCSLDGVSWDGTTVHEVSNLTAGLKLVTITDAQGCTTSGSYTIGQPSTLRIISLVSQDETCDYSNDGTITLNVSGGTANYTCSLDGASWDGTSAHVVTGLSAGSSTVTITDAHSCIASKPYTIDQPPALTITSGVPTDETCDYKDDGTITLSVTGGTPNYTCSLDFA